MPFIWFPTGAAKEGRKLARQRMKERRVAVGVPTDAPLIYKDLSSSMFDMLCLGKPPFRTSRTYTTLVLRKAMTMWGQPTVLGRRLCEQTHGDPRWGGRGGTGGEARQGLGGGRAPRPSKLPTAFRRSD